MVRRISETKILKPARARILKAAIQLFASKGFDGTSVRNIAEKAGLSVPGMFHYFSSKEEILYAIMTAFMDDAYRKIMDIYDSDIDPVEKVSKICRFYVEQYAGHKLQLTILVSERKCLNPEHLRKCMEKERAYVKGLRNLFKDLAKGKQLKPVNPTILTFMFFGMVHWTYRWYDPEAKGGMGPRQLGKIFSDVFLRGALAQGVMRQRR